MNLKRNPDYDKASHRIEFANAPGCFDTFENVNGTIQRFPHVPLADLKAQLQFAIDSHQPASVIQKWSDRIAAHG